MHDARHACGMQHCGRAAELAATEQGLLRAMLIIIMMMIILPQRGMLSLAIFERQLPAWQALGWACISCMFGSLPSTVCQMWVHVARSQPLYTM
jgi:hypothetical protein